MHTRFYCLRIYNLSLTPLSITGHQPSRSPIRLNENFVMTVILLGYTLFSKDEMKCSRQSGTLK